MEYFSKELFGNTVGLAMSEARIEHCGRRPKHENVHRRPDYLVIPRVATEGKQRTTPPLAVG
jgi:hypothetical protein